MSRLWRLPVLLLMLVFAVAPFHWMLIASLKVGDLQLIRGNPWWAETPYLGNYADAIGSALFWQWMANTLLVVGATLLISLLVSLMAAYGLAALPQRLSRPIVIGLFATYLLPQGVLFLPLVKMLSALRLTNSPLALVATYPSLVVPLATWLLWLALSQDASRELIDQARVEGARAWGMLVRVILPIAAPTLAGAALFGLAIVFNDYLYAFTFISRPEAQTLTGAVGTVTVDIGADAGFMFAAMLLGIGPVALVCAMLAARYGSSIATGVIE
jgi:multiple sugar transport system permease protein